MNGDDRTPDEIQADNIGIFMEKGPGLRTSYGTWIVRRDPRGYVMLGGLGAMGVGEMWVNEQTDEIIHGDGSRSAPHSEYPGYADCPIVTRLCSATPPGRGMWHGGCNKPSGHVAAGDPDHFVPEFHLDAETWQGEDDLGSFAGFLFQRSSEEDT